MQDIAEEDDVWESEDEENEDNEMEAPRNLQKAFEAELEIAMGKGEEEDMAVEGEK